MKPETRNSQLLLRPYRPADFDTLWRIDQECFPPGIAYSRAELAHCVKQPGAFTLVGEKDGAIAGYVVAESHRNRGHIVTIDVLPQARRSGLGSKLLAAGEHHLRAAACTSVSLETAVDNHAALAFYKRHGYSVVGTIRRYYQGTLDALRMEKRLTKPSTSKG
ncbi:MAG: GNAT family N-acetyltransferase [Acidobacteria bacterium]|nr:GNAT family N-acetyltransferase [Acidobacteriota bacterium]